MLGAFSQLPLHVFFTKWRKLETVGNIDGQTLCPSGAASEKRQRFHELRCAPLVATCRRPCGAKIDVASGRGATRRLAPAGPRIVATGGAMRSIAQPVERNRLDEACPGGAQAHTRHDEEYK
jgi:hypothetical protein